MVHFIILAIIPILLIQSTFQNEEPVRLAVVKECLNEFSFEKKEMTFLYTIYNLNEHRAARDVELFDEYPEKDFQLIHGTRSARWSFIPASTNVTHSVVIVPRTHGQYNFTSATVTYLADSQAEKSTLHYSNAPGPINIYRYKEYNRRFASHTMEWISFGMIITPCLLIPYVLWRSTASKYLIA